ncbi:MAG: hypothetical protein JSV25_10555, partial [Spirochaetota bacterium]
QMGLMESIFENSDMILNPKYGVIGLFSMPFYILTEIVPPFFELIGYCALALGIGMGVLSWETLLRFFVITWVYSIIHTMYALIMEKYGIGKKMPLHHFIIRMFITLIENLFYRQINIWCKLKGFFRFFTSKREWGAMEREGFAPAEKAS